MQKGIHNDRERLRSSMQATIRQGKRKTLDARSDQMTTQQEELRSMLLPLVNDHWSRSYPVREVRLRLCGRASDDTLST